MPVFDFIINYLDSPLIWGFFCFYNSLPPIPEEVLLLGIGYLVDVARS